jgi:predicted RNA-binding protein with PUA-like domain
MRRQFYATPSWLFLNRSKRTADREYTSNDKGGTTLTERRFFLAKTDPETYAIDQLERDGSTVWDGVRNPQALRAIREMRAGDRVFIYHSMGDAAIVGLADIVGDGRPDPRDPKLAVADFRFLGRVEPPVTLREIKETGQFPDFALVRQSRLSTMSVPPEFVAWFKARRPNCPA